jgi:hypothetical protein
VGALEKIKVFVEIYYPDLDKKQKIKKLLQTDTDLNFIRNESAFKEMMTRL